MVEGNEDLNVAEREQTKRCQISWIKKWQKILNCEGSRIFSEKERHVKWPRLRKVVCRNRGKREGEDIMMIMLVYIDFPIRGIRVKLLWKIWVWRIRPISDSNYEWFTVDLWWWGIWIQMNRVFH
jgi:hypothetical protein